MSWLLSRALYIFTYGGADVSSDIVTDTTADFCSHRFAHCFTIVTHCCPYTQSDRYTNHNSFNTAIIFT
jgi:hypothetical protein